LSHNSKNALGFMSVIPARVGSKGLPGKNIRPFGGKPLITWSIEQAKSSKYIDEVIVSTDDQEIARIGKDFGGEVPFLRPLALAGDDVPTIDVVIHLLQETEKAKGNLPELVVLLQPTSPLRIVADIDNCIEKLVSEKRANAIVSITEVKEHPCWMKTLTKEGFISNFSGDGSKYHRRQDAPSVYKPNGAIYVCRTAALLGNRSFYPDNSLGYVMPAERSVDIDDIVDFELAQLLKDKQQHNSV